MKTACIYYVECIPTQKKYIGRTIDWKRREQRHLFELRNNQHYNLKLQRAWNKYGESAFQMGVLEECSPETLNEREIYWIDFYDSYSNGFNITRGGLGHLGHSPDQETRKKISRNRSGIPVTDERKQRISETVKKRYANDPEYRKKVSEGTSKGQMGRIVSEETKRKISNAQKGKVIPREQIEKMRLTNTGRKFSPEHCAAISKGNLGKVHSEETRAKLSAARKRNPTAKKGEANHLAKLTWEQVREIRYLYANRELKVGELSEKYHVDRHTISAIVHNKTWIE